MNLNELPEIFEQIANLLEIKGENPFKIRAYRNAAQALLRVDDLERMIKEGKLKEINGIGQAISRKIEEYYKTGKMSYYEELKKELPLSLVELMKIPNLGPKRIKILYEKLGITNIGELEYACKENRLLTLFGFGKKTQDAILSGIEFLKKHKGKFLFVDVESQSNTIKKMLKEHFSHAKIEVCGSIRRKSEVVSDIDILVSGEEKQKILQFLLSSASFLKVISDDEEKTVIRLVSGIDLELRTANEEEFPYALFFLTGSKEHVSSIVDLFKKKGIDLTPSNPMIKKIRTEEEIYSYLGLDFIPPELREGRGEIEAAAKKELPVLMNWEDIKGVFHIHTNFSDGLDSIEELVEFSKKLGFQFIGISDHSKSAYYARGLKVEDLKRQWDLIDRINKKEDGFYVFKGIEADILVDGSLDYPDEVLSQFDFVIASIHSHFQLGRKEQTERIIRALDNPFVTIFGHPKGRLLLSREGYEVDMERIIEVSKKNGVILELNSSPFRLDIDWRYLKYAKENGVLISINPDAHSKEGILDTRFGLYMAQKGWLEKKDVLNTREVDELKAFFKSRRGGL